MKWIDQIGGPELEGKKTEMTVLAAGIVGTIVAVLNLFFGIEVGENIVNILTGGFALVLALTLGSRVYRAEKASKEVIASLPKEEKVDVNASGVGSST